MSDEKNPAGTEGKPLRVLSTSLGIALLANALLMTGAAAAEAAQSGSADEPQLVSWSTDEVKAYFDKNVDWNIPYPTKEEFQQEPAATAAPGGTSGGTTIINNNPGGYYHGGFGWDDLLLYHLLLGGGSNYSSRSWHNERRGYYAGTTTPYQPRTYTSGSFTNKPVAGSVAPPKTSASTGTFTKRTTSAKAGSIGGTSGSLGSSSSGSKSSAGSTSSSGKSSISSGSKSGGAKGGFGG